eukprot:gene438-1079_t
MGSKAPKKKESRERVSSAAQKNQEPSTSIAPILEKDEKGRKGNKVPIPVWPEWTDQDIAAEKWDTGHKGRVEHKGKSPNASVHYFEEPEGRIELPTSLKDKVYSWRRPQDFVTDGKTPVIVEQESLKCKEIDLVSSCEAVADSELMRWIISGVTALYKIQNPAEQESSQSSFALKPKPSKEPRETKQEKNKKESEVFYEEIIWKPWYHIWPKDNNKFNAVPNYNPGGKYCVKIFWMGTWRKITVDDFMPFDEKGKILLPTTSKENELWPMLLSKALIKVASLDYAGGSSFSEMGDTSIIHSLTGWLPEPIPLKYGHTDEIWQLLMDILPNWKLPTPSGSASSGKVADKDSGKQSTDDEAKKDESPRPEAKESKEGKEAKGSKKDDKEGGGGGKETGGSKEKSENRSKQKDKSQDKDKDAKSKDKVSLASTTQARVNTEPEYVVFASYSPPPTSPLRVSTLKEMADSSEKLRLFGLSHNHPHPVHLTMVRNCPLVAPPTPIQIPRWKLIRQKKKQQIVEPPPKKEAPKQPLFVELASPFINYCVSPIPVNRVATPVKWKSFRPETPMDSLSEEDKTLQDENQEESKKEQENTDENDNITEQTAEVSKTNDEQKICLVKPSVSIEKPSTPTKSPSASARSIGSGKKDSASSEKGNLSESESVTERKSNRKTSIMLPKSEHGSAKHSRKMSKMERLDTKMLDKIDKDGRDSKESRIKTRESKELIEVVPEIEVFKPDDDIETEGNEREGEKPLSAEEDEGKDEMKHEKKQELWMEYDDFCQCFSTLWIFHKSQTYSFYRGHAELKSVETKTDKSKKTANLNPTASNVAPTPSGRYTAAAVSPSQYGSHQPLTDASMPYMFVDSVSKIELLVSFSSFSRWFEPLFQGLLPLKEKDGSDIDDKSTKESTPVVPPSGTLIAEPYSWKSLVTGQPTLRIKTTGIKGAVLTLPPGRHVLRFMIQAPIGYHVDICSQTPFAFGDEDAVMQNLTKESLGYTHHATKTLQNFMDIITTFNDQALRTQRTLQIGTENEPPETFSRHFEALFQALSQTASEKKCGTFLSIEALKLESAIRLKKSLIASCDQSSYEVPQVTDDNISAIKLDDDASKPIVMNLSEREQAAVKIQALIRGHLVRLLVKARQPGTPENEQTIEELKRILEIVQSNNEQFALQMYRNMFRDDPDLYKLFPFYKDEWTRISYADYNGSYPEQPVNSWFIVFRETFYVEEPVLVVPKLYVNIPSCVLRVIDNDTGDELPRVFVRVAPKVLQKNKNGYTFVAEARSTNASVPAGKFRMRLIGAGDPLPKPYKEGFMTTNFATKEIRDHYIPNRNNIILRYTVRVTNDHQVSIQLGTSKSDVYIKLDILDNEIAVASSEGKGHTVIPAFTFLRDHIDDDEEKASHRSSRLDSGRSSVKGGRGKKDNAKRATSPFEKATRKLEKVANTQGKIKGSESTDTLDKSAEEPEHNHIHKYIIQATVQRDSWPLSRSQWDFVGILKNLEKTEGEAVEPVTKTEKHSAGPKGKKGVKEGKDSRSSKSHPNAGGSRPSSQQFDNSKPNWVLRICDTGSNEIEIKKDTERQDEIKAMKAAWETAQPGRAAKAQQTRLNFLKENTVRIEKENKDPNHDEGDQGPKIDSIESAREPVQVSVSPGPSIELESSELTLVPPVKEQETMLKTIDITPFIRSTGQYILLDDTEEQKLQEKTEEKLQAYRYFRERVLHDREADRVARNMEKEKQLQEYEEMQAKLDECRQQIHAKREAYRQKFLEQPPPDAESDTSKKRKTPSPARGRKSPRSKSPKNAGKSKSPGKGKKR